MLVCMYSCHSGGVIGLGSLGLSPMWTLPEPVMILPPQSTASVTRAAGLPLISTLPEPSFMKRGCGGDFGATCGISGSPLRAAGRPLIATSPLPTMTGVGGYLPCLSPMSPSRAAGCLLSEPMSFPLRRKLSFLYLRVWRPLQPREYFIKVAHRGATISACRGLLTAARARRRRSPRARKRSDRANGYPATLRHRGAVLSAPHPPCLAQRHPRGGYERR